MHNARTLNAANAGKVFAMMEECVHQGACQVSGRRMGDKPGLLVEDKDIASS